MSSLKKIQSVEDIPSIYRDNPIGLLLEYHNLNRPFETYREAKLLTGMCMDNRKHLNIPDNFSFIIRTGGANMQHSEFKISFAVSVGGVSHMALIGHNHCGMVNLFDRKEQFVNGLVKTGGWDEKAALEHFMKFAPQNEVGNEQEFILSEVKRLRLIYPKMMIAPMIYLVEDNKLYLLNEDNK